MNSDLGMLKPVLPGTAQTNSAAPAGRTENDASAKQNPNAARGAEKAEETAKEDKQLDTVVSGLNQLVHDLQRELQFSVDKESGDTVIKVIDSKTDEVLRQIPSEELMRLRQRLEKAAGIIFQDEA